MKISKATWIIMLSAILAAGVHVQAQPTEEPILQLLSEMAEKPEHHQSIANYYRTMADEARAEVEKHKAMKNTYRHSHAKQKGQRVGQRMSKHCDRLIKLHQSSVKEYEALAELHEAEARKE